LPLTGVFFSWGTEGLGWGQGLWFSPDNQTGTLVLLPDDNYRILILATIASNQWDGTIPGAYDVLKGLFNLAGFQIMIQDNQDMTISIIFLSKSIDAVSSAMLTSGLLTVRPAGVRVDGYYTATEPVFGFGREDSVISGWGAGSWIQLQSLTSVSAPETSPTSV
jgi:hypothetical protein